MKKALAISIEAPVYSSMAMLEALEERFERVEFINWQQLRFNVGLECMWDTIYRTCDALRPDFIFIQFQTGEVVTPENVMVLSTYGKVVNYTEDVREDISWIENMHPYLSLSVFTNRDDVEKMKALGFNSIYTHVPYNHLWYYPQPATNTDYGDIVFLGNNYTGSNLGFPQAEKRQQMVAEMKKAFGNRFRAYGLGQENRMLNPHEARECYNNCKIAISFNNFKRRGYQSDRYANATGCGALTMYLAGEYPYGNMAVCSYQNIYHLADLCNEALDSPAVSKSIAEYQKIYAERNFKWTNLIDAMLKKLKNGQ